MRTTILPMISTLAALIFIAGAERLHAQRWQYEYGPAGTSIEIGGRGVEPVSSGGYIAAGGSHGSSGIRDMYVVRTNDDGSLAWSYTYNVENGHSGAVCIRECANGDFIVLGSTQTQSTCCCQPRNVILMRLKPDGSVIWMKSYGSPLGEAASSVIEMTTGDGDQTSPGDFVVCGTATNSDGTTRAYILRTTAGGKLIWDNTLALQRSGSSLYCVENSFSDIDESPGNGSILAVGTIRETSLSPTKGIIFRIDGSTGSPIGDQRWWQLDLRSTVGTSIRELSGNVPGTSAGDIAVTGHIDRGSGVTNTYIARFLASSCRPTVARYYLSGHTSSGNDIQERANGNLIVAGMAQLSGASTGQAMLIEAEPVNLAYAGTLLHLYGQATTTDVAASVQEVPASGSQTAGFILAGTTGAADQLYMIKTDNTGDSYCNWSAPDDSERRPADTGSCNQYNEVRINMWCQPSWTADPRTWENELCYSVTRAMQQDDPDEATSAVQPTDLSIDATIPLSDDASVAGYPNPVRKGSAFKVEYAQARPGHIAIDVVDITGKTVYTHAGDYPAGTSQIPVSTDGWASGTYVLKLTRDGATAVQRITVMDK